MHLVELRWLLGGRYPVVVLSQLGLVQQIVDQVLHHYLRLGRLQLADGDGHVLPEYAVLVHMIGTQAAAAPVEWLWGRAAAVAGTGHCSCIQGCGAGVVAGVAVAATIVVVAVVVIIIGSA